MEPGDECRSFFVFTRCSLVLEGSTDPNDLFNLRDVRVAMVDGISHSGNGGEDGLIGGDVVRELDGMSGSAEWLWWCLNGGTVMIQQIVAGLDLSRPWIECSACFKVMLSRSRESVCQVGSVVV